MQVTVYTVGWATRQGTPRAKAFSTKAERDDFYGVLSALYNSGADSVADIITGEDVLTIH